jgi:hypothetical protein
VKTTVDIPDPIYRQLKSKAALLGCSVRALILRAVKDELNDNQPGNQGHDRVKLPLIRSKRPGSLKLTNKMINEILFP